MPALNCGTQSVVSRNQFRSSLTFDVNNPGDQPPWPPGGAGNPNLASFHWRISLSTTGPGGPWSPAPLISSFTSLCGTPVTQPVPLGGATSDTVSIGDTVPTIQPGTTYSVRWELFNELDVKVAEQICPSVTTPLAPDTLNCLGATISATSVRLQYGVTNPPGAQFQPDTCFTDQVQWTYADNPGFFSPTVLPFAPINGLAPSHVLTGLKPDTTYHYVAQFKTANGADLVSGPVCSVDTGPLVWCGKKVPHNTPLVFVGDNSTFGGGTWRPVTSP